MNPLMFPYKSIPSLEIIKLSIECPKQEVYILTKPLAAIQAISSGIPKCHRTFWNAMSLSELYEIYIACSASAEKVINLLVDDPMDDNQQRVYGYLCQYIGNMGEDELLSLPSFYHRDTNLHIRMDKSCL